MRFGKTFAAYELAKKMGFKRVLVLTFKPAVESAWREDLVTHFGLDTRPLFPHSRVGERLTMPKYSV